jgi:hypothetical protein
MYCVHLVVSYDMIDDAKSRTGFEVIEPSLESMSGVESLPYPSVRLHRLVWVRTSQYQLSYNLILVT